MAFFLGSTCNSLECLLIQKVVGDPTLVFSTKDCFIFSYQSSAMQPNMLIVMLVGLPVVYYVKPSQIWLAMSLLLVVARVVVSQISSTRVKV